MDYDPVQGMLALGYASGRVDLHGTSNQYRQIDSSVAASGDTVAHLKLLSGHPSLVAIDAQGMLRVYDTDTLDMCFTYKVPSMPVCISQIPSTPWLLVGTEMGRVYFVNCVGGQKSDFSIGSQTQPPAPVIAVKAHPVNTERLLIAYEEGTICVHDLGKAATAASAPELNAVVGKYSAAAQQQQKEFQILTSAGWSPTGDQIVAVYSNGSICIFNTRNAGDKRHAALTLPVARRLLENQSIGGVWWCTQEETLESKPFLLLTSGPTMSYQDTLHVFSTDGSALVPCDQMEFDTSILSLCTAPWHTPWRNGCEDVRQLMVLLSGEGELEKLPPRWDLCVVDVGSDLKLRQSPQSNVSGAIEWCTRPQAKLVQLDRRMSSGKMLFNRVDNKGGLSLWTGGLNDLSPCRQTGVLDTALLSSFLGIGKQSTLSVLDMCQNSKLLVAGMDSGEAIICTLSGDSGVPPASLVTDAKSLRDQAADFYQEGKQHVAASVSKITDPNSRATISSPASKHHLPLASVRRSRSSSHSVGNSGGFIRRRSKRLSATLSTLFRRGSSQTVPGDSAKSNSSMASSNIQQGAEDVIQAGLNQLQLSTAGGGSSSTTRKLPFDVDSWKSMQSQVCKELSQMLYGLKLDAVERKQLGIARTPTNEAIGMRQRMDSGAPGIHYGNVKSGMLPLNQRYLEIVPFMMARFYNRRLVKVVAAANGGSVVALIYSGGPVVVVDYVKQYVVLADNANQPSIPEANDQQQQQPLAKELFSSPTDGGGATEITAVELTNELDGNGETWLLVGTSQGQVYGYPLSQGTGPQQMVSIGDGNSPVMHISAVATRQRQLVIGTTQMITTYSIPGFRQIGSSSCAGPKRFVAMAVVGFPESSGASVRQSVVATANTDGAVTLFDLPKLQTVLNAPIPNAQKLLGAGSRNNSNVCIQIGRCGNIQMLDTNDGTLLQAAVAKSGQQPSTKSLYNPNIAVPSLPARKGITSWLFGKSSNASQDIEHFLGSHHRNLLRNGQRRPGERFIQKPQAPLNPDTNEPPASKARGLRDQAATTGLAEGMSEARDMLNARGEKLNDLQERIQGANVQARSYLDNIRAYNARQEAKASKKKFGLF